MFAPIELDAQTLFAGRYRVLRRIAAGGMGAVFEVQHNETQRRSALKVMLPELVANADLRERFRLEARITARIHSEYIVDVLDAGIDLTTGMPFLVMELLHGDQLGELLKKNGALAASEALTYLRQVAFALDKTHAAAIVHRDLKPENLFLTQREDGTPRIKILDFGISKVVEGHSASGTVSLGTPLYMAPEQMLGEAVSPATDLYSLGLIAFTLLVGVPYWTPDTTKYDNSVAFVLHAVKGPPESAVTRAARLGRSLPSAFDAWFKRATHVDPRQRFARASELVQALSIALAGPAVHQESAKMSLLGAPTLGALDGRSTRTSVAPVHSSLLPAATAPGTEMDRAASNPAAARPRTRVLGLVAISITLTALVGAAVATHTRSSASNAEGVPVRASAMPSGVSTSRSGESAIAIGALTASPVSVRTQSPQVTVASASPPGAPISPPTAMSSAANTSAAQPIAHSASPAAFAPVATPRVVAHTAAAVSKRPAPPSAPKITADSATPSPTYTRD